MTLGPGSRVGPYEIVELVGSGGMGEVYRARDPRLGREVAIKVLPERFARSADRLRRFEREARAAGALSHPGILTVFDVGAHDGMPYIVTELLDGETMRTALRTQRFGVRQSLAWAIEVARALACAHDAGILHRDLKPDNLFLTRDGRVKILDFGIAKLFQPEGGTPRDADTATRETLDGGIAGTAAYMSPEQIRDEPLDERCDVFALGATLFEMLSQRAPFAAPTQSDIIATVLRDDPPPLADSGIAAGPALEAVVRRCLEKRRESRYRTAREVAAALEALLATPGIDQVTMATSAERPRTILASRARWAVPLLVVAVVGTALAVARSAGRAPVPPSPLISAPPPSPEPLLLTSSPGRELEPALARDGQRIAFVWDGAQGDNFDLYTKVVGTEMPLRLTTHPAYDGTPAWSPDGRWIAFVRVDGRRARVVLIPSTGGPERVLRELEPWFGTSVAFSPDGRRIAVSERPAPGAPFGIALVTVDTGEATVLTRPDPSNAGDAFPAFSPDGGTLAFARLPAHGASLLWAALSVVPTQGGEPRIVQWSDRVVGGLDWTADGQELVFSAADHEEGPQLWRIPISGGAPARPFARMSNLFGAEAVTQVSRFFRVSVAHEGGRIAYAQSRYHTDIWKIDVASPRRSPGRPVVASTQVDEAPQISPDGRRIAFSSSRMSRSSQIWTCDMQGAACAQLTTFESACGTPRWAPDSRHVVFDAGEGGQSDLYVVDVETNVSRRLTSHQASDIVPSWSRDGKSVYFASDRTGSYEVWKVPAEGGEAAQVTSGGGFAAFESQDAREVFFTRYGTPGLWALPVGGGTERAVLADEPMCWGYWALGRAGIFLVDSTPATGPRIAFQPFSGAPRRRIAALPAEPACGESGIAVSPDERTLLYVGTSRESDVVMIDAFH